MNNIFLTIDEAKMLLLHGADMSDATMCYVATGSIGDKDCEEQFGQEGDHNCTYVKTMTIGEFTDIRKELYADGECYRKGDIVPTYTMQEMIDKMPLKIEDDYRFVFERSDNGWCCGYVNENDKSYKIDLLYFVDVNPIKAVYNLYKMMLLTNRL